MARIITVTSGNEGVGKTNISVNIAIDLGPVRGIVSVCLMRI